MLLTMPLVRLRLLAVAVVALCVDLGGGAEALGVSGGGSQLVEMNELQERVNDEWRHLGYRETSGVAVAELMPAPPGWEWATEWILDSGGAAPGEGWEYFVQAGRRCRRRRWVRVLRRLPSPDQTIIPPQRRNRKRRPSAKTTTKRTGRPKVAKQNLLIAAAKNQTALAVRAVRNDFTFRGVGTGLSVAAFGWRRRSVGLVISVPLSPNFASWDRRSHYLPMVSCLIFCYPQRYVYPRPKPGTYAFAVVFSFSYPFDVLKRGATAPIRLLQRNKTRDSSTYPRGVKLGARSVQRVGFSVSSRVYLTPLELRLAVSTVQLRPWFMYAPGLRLLVHLVDAALITISKCLMAAELLVLNASTTPLALESNTTLDVKSLNQSHVSAKAKTNLSTSVLTNSTTPVHLTENSSTKTKISPNTALARQRAAATAKRGALSSTIGKAVEITQSFKAWFDSKTSVLGVNFLPIDTELYRHPPEVGPVTAEEASMPIAGAAPAKPWRASVFFVMRPFFPRLPKFILRRLIKNKATSSASSTPPNIGIGSSSSSSSKKLTSPISPSSSKTSGGNNKAPPAGAAAVSSPYDTSTSPSSVPSLVPPPSSPPQAAQQALLSRGGSHIIYQKVRKKPY